MINQLDPLPLHDAYDGLRPRAEALDGIIDGAIDMFMKNFPQEPQFINGPFKK